MHEGTWAGSGLGGQDPGSSLELPGPYLPPGSLVLLLYRVSPEWTLKVGREGECSLTEFCRWQHP